MNRIKSWKKEYPYKDGILEYDNHIGWTYLIKGSPTCTIIRLPFTQKKIVIEMLEGKRK